MNLCLSKKLILNCYNSVQSLGATPASNPNFYYIVYNIYIYIYCAKFFIFIFSRKTKGTKLIRERNQKIASLLLT